MVHLLILPAGSRGLQYASFKNVVNLKCYKNIGKDRVIDIYLRVTGICVLMNCAMLVLWS